MANQLGSNPWVIDTAGAAILYSHPLKVLHFEWGGYTTQTHTVVVKDQNGKTIWTTDGGTSLTTVTSGNPVGWVEGLSVPTIGSGQLFVYFG